MPQRTRTRGSTTPAQAGSWSQTQIGWYAYTNPQGQTYTQQVGEMGRAALSAESITDAVDGTRNLHSCTHTRESGGADTVPCYFIVEEIANGGTRRIDVNMAPGYTAIQAIGHLSGIPDGTAVARSKVPHYSNEALSSLNSLYEIGDLVDSVKKIPIHLMWSAMKAGGTKRLTYNIVQHLGSQIRKFKRDPYKGLADFVGGIVGMDLAWKFGWGQFIGDIQKVHTALGQYEAKLAAIADKQFVVRGMHTESRQTSFPGSGYNYTGNPGWTYDVSCQKTTTATWVSGSVRRINPDIIKNVDSTRMRLLAEQLGLTLEVKDVWAQVPLSFVVDWFLPISTFLSQFEKTNRSLPGYHVVAEWSSVKIITQATTTSKVTVKPLPAAYLRLLESSLPLNVANTSRSTYTRTVGPWSAPPLYIPQFRSLGSLNGTKIWTGIELAYQRMLGALR